MRDTYLSATTRALRQDRGGTPEPKRDTMQTATTEPTIYACPVTGGENTPLYLGMPLGAISRTDQWHDAKAKARDGLRGKWFGPYTDQTTGAIVKVRPAACGSGCFCAAEYKIVQDAPEPTGDAMHPLDAPMKRGDAMLAVIKAARHWSRETSANGSPVDALKAANALHYAVYNLDRVEAQTGTADNA